MVFSYSVVDAGLTAPQVIARGTTPHLFAEPTHSFLLANPWIQKVPLIGPAGETQILEQELEKAVLHLGFTSAPLDAAGLPMSLVSNALRADAMETVWARAVADGFDVSAPFATEGELYKALASFATSLTEGGGVPHGVYYLDYTHWYSLGVAPSVAAGNHWMYGLTIEAGTDPFGSLLPAARLLCHVSGRHIGVNRHLASGCSLPPPAGGNVGGSVREWPCPA